MAVATGAVDGADFIAEVLPDSCRVLVERVGPGVGRKIDDPLVAAVVENRVDIGEIGPSVVGYDDGHTSHAISRFTTTLGNGFELEDSGVTEVGLPREANRGAIGISHFVPQVFALDRVSDEHRSTSHGHHEHAGVVFGGVWQKNGSTAQLRLDSFPQFLERTDGVVQVAVDNCRSHEDGLRVGDKIAAVEVEYAADGLDAVAPGRQILRDTLVAGTGGPDFGSHLRPRAQQSGFGLAGSGREAEPAVARPGGDRVIYDDGYKTAGHGAEVRQQLMECLIVGADDVHGYVFRQLGQEAAIDGEHGLFRFDRVVDHELLEGSLAVLDQLFRLR